MSYNSLVKIKTFCFRKNNKSKWFLDSEGKPVSQDDIDRIINHFLRHKLLVDIKITTIPSYDEFYTKIMYTVIYRFPSEASYLESFDY